MDVHADGDIAENFWWRRTTSTRRGPLYDICVAAGLLLAATIVGVLPHHLLYLSPLHQIQILLPVLLHLSCCCLWMLCLMIRHILLP